MPLCVYIRPVLICFLLIEKEGENAEIRENSIFGHFGKTGNNVGFWLLKHLVVKCLYNTFYIFCPQKKSINSRVVKNKQHLAF